jgi:hypothetical protein
MNGTSPIAFNVPFANYYVCIRHRNHLGFRTLNTIPLSNSSNLLDFTTNMVALYGTTPLNIIVPNVYVLNVGDANSDGSIDAFDDIIWSTNNGLFDDYQQNSDYNLDGSIDAFDNILWSINNGKFEELD